ncbi:MAG: peptide chain release factor 2 [Eubacteriales bacterium]
MVVELENMKQELKNYEQPLVEVRDSLDLAAKEQRIEELERRMEEPDFWNNPDEAQKETKELGDLKNDRDSYKKLVSAREDIETLIEMGEEENDASVVPEVREMLDQFIDDLDDMRIKTLLSEEYDDRNAIVKLNSGAGGTEAMDWCSMLYRMYTRWAERKGFRIEVLDYQEGDEAGIKSVMFQVNGENAYGLLKSEAGVHRLVRISPFNAQAKRQTSFVSADVMPELDNDINIEVPDKDIRVDTYRSSGAGGQHINKTSSAIRITHLPTGIVVTCQNERSQHMNKDKAMQVLKAKLYMLEQQKQEEEAADIRGEVTDIAWGHQIRSYVLQPYTMVKDLRTGEERAQADAVLDGDIDRFIFAYLKWKALQKKERAKQSG